MSNVTIVRAAATDLTANYVYCDAIRSDNVDQHNLVIEYDPDANDGVLNVIVEISQDPMDTATASSSWTQIGAISVAAGVGTFTATTLQVAAAAAGTKKYAHWIFEGNAYKVRVGMKETFTAGGSNFGNCKATLFSTVS
jgi:hypothetical protein